MTKELIFEIRTKLDPKRQPMFQDDVQALKQHVIEIPAAHPYDLPFPDRLSLCALVKSFATGAQGEHATLDSTHLYRIASIGQLVRSLTWKNRTNDDTAFEPIFAANAAGIAWVPLADFANGAFQNYRAFSWWTPFDLTSVNLWNAWRRIGLLDDWIMHDSVLMRCRREALAKIVVPTAIDGFEGPVFEAMSARPASTAGRAIDLSVRPFRPGELEVVAGPIPVDCIELRPVLIPENLKNKGVPVRDTLETWVELERYYRACCE